MPKIVFYADIFDRIYHFWSKDSPKDMATRMCENGADPHQPIRAFVPPMHLARDQHVKQWSYCPKNWPKLAVNHRLNLIIFFPNLLCAKNRS